MKIEETKITSTILGLVAGYADTSTFVGADRLFSAHVTGNFVVFAYDIVTNQMSSSWIKLISFPVFILSVIFSTLLIDDASIYKKSTNRLLVIEGFLLITAGGLTYFYRYENMVYTLRIIIPMLVVFALGLQNAYGRFFAKEILAPTTVMTGNITQLFIDMTNYLKPSKLRRQEIRLRIINGIYVILPFLIGCIGGGLITRSIGLSSTVFPGILILIISFIKNRQVISPGVSI